MASDNANRPAFVEGKEWSEELRIEFSTYGLTKREYMATHIASGVITGIVSRADFTGTEMALVAEIANKTTDALLEELSK